MTDVADDCTVLHIAHVIHGDHVAVAGGGNEDIGLRCRLLHGHDFIAFHRRLQGADRIDFGHHHARAALAERRGRPLAHVTIAGDDGNLAGKHHVRRPADAVHKRLATAIQVVEFRLRHRVVYVDCRERQTTRLGKLI